MNVEEVWIESWRRCFDGRKEFVNFRIILRMKNTGDEMVIEKRYSELLEFHEKVKNDSIRFDSIYSYPNINLYLFAAVLDFEKIK